MDGSLLLPEVDAITRDVLLANVKMYKIPDSFDNFMTLKKQLLTVLVKDMITEYSDVHVTTAIGDLNYILDSTMANPTAMLKSVRSRMGDMFNNIFFIKWIGNVHIDVAVVNDSLHIIMHKGQ